MVQFIAVESNWGLTKDLFLLFPYKLWHLSALASSKSIQSYFINQISLSNIESFYLAYYLGQRRDSQTLFLAYVHRKEKMPFEVHYKCINTGRGGFPLPQCNHSICHMALRFADVITRLCAT